MKKIKFFLSMFLCLMMIISPLTSIKAVGDTYILNDVMVSSFNNQGNNNYKDSQTLIVGKGRHAYIRIDLSKIDKSMVEVISFEGKKKNNSNTFIISQCSEFLNDGKTIWNNENITYNNRPEDLSDSPIKEYRIANGEQSFSLDVKDLLLDALNDGKNVITLHITTNKVDDGTIAASEIYSSRTLTPPTLKITLSSDEKPSVIEPTNNEENYLDNGAIAEKTFQMKDEDGHYLKLNSDETFSTTDNENLAAVFNLYIFDYKEYQYSDDEIDYAKTFYAIKCLDNNKYLTIQNYFSEDDRDKSYYNKIDDVYEIKASANDVNWNERFDLEHYKKSNKYTISTHLTVYRDNAGYTSTMIRMKDDMLFSTEKNKNIYKFEFVDVDNHDQLEVRQEVTGTSVKLSWYPVNDDKNLTHYNLANGILSVQGDKIIATVDNLVAGNNEIIVNYSGNKKQTAKVNVRVFNHPGVTHTAVELDAIREHISNKEEPWYSDYQKLQTMVPDNMASSSYQSVALEAVGRGDNTPVGHDISYFEQSGNAAYFNALQWVITGDEKYAQCTVDILNDWSSTLKVIDGRDRILGAGINSYRYINAAEIIKYYQGGYSGYKDKDFKMFQYVMENVIYPVIEDLGAPMMANGNWDTASMITMIAIGVVCDNTEIYDRAVKLYQDIHVNGSIAVYVSEWGQSVESFRDQAHAQLGIGYMAEVCQIALNQGNNLYSLYDNRLAKAFNWAAQYNLYNTNGLKMEPLRDVFGNVKWTSIDSEKINRGELRPVYELPLAYYSNIQGVDMAWTAKAAGAMRAQGYVHNDNLNFGTLTTYNGELTTVCEPFFQIRTRLEPWYQRTWNDAKKYGELVDNIPETLNSYFAVNNSGEVVATSKKADAPYYQLENNQDGTYAIRSTTTNTYLSIKEEKIGEENVIKADAKTVGKNEKFILKCTGANYYYLQSAEYGNRIVYVHVDNSNDPQNAILTMRLGTKITNKSSEISNNEKLILVYNTKDIALNKIDLANTDDLEALVYVISKLNNDQNKYTSESFDILLQALLVANQGIQDAKYGRIDDKEVASLYQNLKDAYAGLVLINVKPDNSNQNNDQVVDITDTVNNNSDSKATHVKTGDDRNVEVLLAMFSLLGLGICVYSKFRYSN